MRRRSLCHRASHQKELQNLWRYNLVVQGRVEFHCSDILAPAAWRKGPRRTESCSRHTCFNLHLVKRSENKFDSNVYNHTVQHIPEWELTQSQYCARSDPSHLRTAAVSSHAGGLSVLAPRLPPWCCHASPLQEIIFPYLCPQQLHLNTLSNNR